MSHDDLEAARHVHDSSFYGHVSATCPYHGHIGHMAWPRAAQFLLSLRRAEHADIRGVGKVGAGEISCCASWTCAKGLTIWLCQWRIGHEIAASRIQRNGMSASPVGGKHVSM